MTKIPIRADVLQAIDDWNAGRSLRTIDLGHSHRMKEIPGRSPVIDESKRYHRDQERAHEFCFAILENFSKDGAPESHDEFLAVCEEISTRVPDLTPEERIGAESLAWKALVVGWKRAIAGHGEEFYIEVSRPKVKVT
jgi:hypothetical protein